mmetsp:Transcript_53296/g.105979  ORF Transcript_53296/g.105979 Transcript_53296/m.105979 type:complete len:268 (+) Transcript_53296:632-1435(+)
MLPTFSLGPCFFPQDFGAPLAFLWNRLHLNIQFSFFVCTPGRLKHVIGEGHVLRVLSDKKRSRRQNALVLRFRVVGIPWRLEVKLSGEWLAGTCVGIWEFRLHCQPHPLKLIITRLIHPHAAIVALYVLHVLEAACAGELRRHGLPRPDRTIVSSHVEEPVRRSNAGMADCVLSGSGNEKFQDLSRRASLVLGEKQRSGARHMRGCHGRSGHRFLGVITLDPCRHNAGTWSIDIQAFAVVAEFGPFVSIVRTLRSLFAFIAEFSMNR